MDSELVAELLYSSLSLFRWLNQKLLAGESASAWQSYLNYLRGFNPLCGLLIDLLNVTRWVEVPLEMLVTRIVTRDGRWRLIFVIELVKSMMKVAIWMLTEYRPLPDQLYSPSLTNNPELSEDRVKDLLLARRVDAYQLVPELVFLPAKGLEAKLRELSHLLRPLFYATGCLVKGGPTWSIWIGSLAMDLYSQWPRLVCKNLTLSPLAKREADIRLVNLLWYLLRGPLYQHYTRGRLAALEGRLDYALLKPMWQTLKSYQSLWDRVYFYTAHS